MDMGVTLNDLNADGRVHISEMYAIVKASGSTTSGFAKLFIMDIEFRVDVTAQLRLNLLITYPIPPIPSLSPNLQIYFVDADIHIKLCGKGHGSSPFTAYTTPQHLIPL